ncbi:MAG: hypothetical protein JRN52_12185 [Nitrososphaerota archaeon]|nr:hypothetical protein [Nitrososphaerota archaeon]
MSREKIALLGLTVGLMIIGAVLAIFGAIYTVLGCTTDNVFYGYPIWSPPRWNTPIGCGNLTVPPGVPNGISVNYTLNYLGIAVLIMAAALWVLENRRGNKQKKIIEGNEIQKTRAEIRLFKRPLFLMLRNNVCLRVLQQEVRP